MATCKGRVNDAPRDSGRLFVVGKGRMISEVIQNTLG